MKKTLRRNRAFVFVILTAVIAVLAMEVFAMTGLSNKIAFDARKAYLRACCDNSIQSGLAWVEHNKNQFSFDDNVILDVNSLGAKNAELSVSAAKSRAVIIKTTCSRGNLNVNQEKVLSLQDVKNN